MNYKKYLVIQCHRCMAVRYVRSTQKTYYCFKCRGMRQVKNAIIIWDTDDIREATYIVRYIRGKGLDAFFKLFRPTTP